MQNIQYLAGALERVLRESGAQCRAKLCLRISVARSDVFGKGGNFQHKETPHVD